MKTANEEFFNCSMFQKNVSAFIDNELDEVVKEKFIAHVAKCTGCSTLLTECTHFKKHLGKLIPVKVSPEFDFRLKARIRLENTRLYNPLYRSKLYIRDNWKMFLAVPAAAIIILIGVFSHPDLFNYSNLTETIQITSRMNGKEPASPSEDSSEEIVYYVLESVKPKEIEKGIFLSEQNVSIQVTSTNPNIKLISF